MPKKDPTAGWLVKSQKKLKRLFAAKYSASKVKTDRFDHNVAVRYNQQRSKTTMGSGPDTEPNMHNNFMREVPQTRSLTLVDPKTGNVLRDEEGKPIRSKRGEAVDDRKELIEFEKKTLLQLYLEEPQLEYGPNWYNVVELNSIGDNFKQVLVWRGTEFLIVQTYRGNVSVSRTYHNRAEAIADFVTKNVDWRIVN